MDYSWIDMAIDLAQDGIIVFLYLQISQLGDRLRRVEQKR
jgi:hypothetical protein